MIKFLLIHVTYLIQTLVIYKMHADLGAMKNTEGKSLLSIWREIKTLGDNVSLYPANYNVEKVRWALQSAKILSAEKMLGPGW